MLKKFIIPVIMCVTVQENPVEFNDEENEKEEEKIDEKNDEKNDGDKDEENLNELLENYREKRAAAEFSRGSKHLWGTTIEYKVDRKLKKKSKQPTTRRVLFGLRIRRI